MSGRQNPLRQHGTVSCAVASTKAWALFSLDQGALWNRVLFPWDPTSWEGLFPYSLRSETTCLEGQKGTFLLLVPQDDAHHPPASPVCLPQLHFPACWRGRGSFCESEGHVLCCSTDGFEHPPVHHIRQELQWACSMHGTLP